MYRAILVVALLNCISCTADNTSETTPDSFADPDQAATARIDPVAVHPPADGPRQLSAQQVQYAMEALVENLVRTDLTVLLEIRAVTRGDPNAGDADAGEELVQVWYSAKVMQRYAGDAADTISYVQYIDAEEIPGVKVGDMRIVSLCKDETGQFYLPDIGYELPATEAIKEQAFHFAQGLEDDQRLQRETGLQSDCR